MSFRCAGRFSLLPLERARIAVPPVSSLCAKLSYLVASYLSYRHESQTSHLTQRHMLCAPIYAPPPARFGITTLLTPANPFERRQSLLTWSQKMHFRKTCLDKCFLWGRPQNSPSPSLTIILITQTINCVKHDERLWGDYTQKDLSQTHCESKFKFSVQQILHQSEDKIMSYL